MDTMLETWINKLRRGQIAPYVSSSIFLHRTVQIWFIVNIVLYTPESHEFLYEILNPLITNWGK